MGLLAPLRFLAMLVATLLVYFTCLIMENVEIKISRKGVIIKTLSRAEVFEGIESGELQATDHFWFPGMREWGLLKDFKPTPEPLANPRKRVSYITSRQLAYLRFLGVVPPLGERTLFEDASRLIDETHDKADYRDGWAFYRIVHHPDLYEHELRSYLNYELVAEFKAYVRTQVIDSSQKLTKPIIAKVFDSLQAVSPTWWHPDNRLEIAYSELKRSRPECCDGTPVRDYGELVEIMHSYVRSRVIGCSGVLTKTKVVSVIQALCAKDQAWMNKTGRSELFWGELKQMYPDCCDGRTPSPKQEIVQTRMPGRAFVGEPVKSSGCLIVMFAFGAGLVAIWGVGLR